MITNLWPAVSTTMNSNRFANEEFVTFLGFKIIIDGILQNDSIYEKEVNAKDVARAIHN
jgi:hypothetical protein